MSLSTDLPLAARPTHVRYVVVAALCLAAAVAYIQRNSYGGADTTITHELHLTEGQRGDAVSLFFFSYALLQVPSGWLAQRAGPRLTLGCIAAGWSVALGLCALAVNPNTLIGGRLLMGVMQAGIFPCCTLILTAWLPPTQRGTASALLNSFMLIGGALSSNLTGLLIEPLGWRGVFFAFAVPGLVWALLFLVWFRNRPADHPGVNDAELAVIGCPPPSERAEPVVGDAAPPNEQGIKAGGETGLHAERGPIAPRLAGDSRSESPTITRRSSSWFILLSGALYLICLQQFFRAGANRFFDNWFTTYLQEARGVNRVFANQLASLPQWAGVFGGLVGGVLSDCLLVWTGSRRLARQGVAVGSLVVCLVLYWFAYLIPNVTLATLVCSASFFIFSFSAPCAYAITMDMGGRNLGVIFGAMNMLGNFGAYAFTALAPRLTGWYGDWNATLLLFFAMHIAALLCWLLLNPNGVIGERAAAPESKE